jgi:predicted regulator of Ras-like GTPase activity (Roadblock/LC7/MglB family)
MTAIESLLQRCLAIHGIQAVLVADTDGMVVHSAMAPLAQVDGEALGAYAAALVNEAAPLLETTHASRWECAQWEAKSGFVLIARVGASGLVAVVGTDVLYAPVVRLCLHDIKGELEQLFVT